MMVSSHLSIYTYRKEFPQGLKKKLFKKGTGHVDSGAFYLTPVLTASRDFPLRDLASRRTPLGLHVSTLSMAHARDLPALCSRPRAGRRMLCCLRPSFFNFEKRISSFL